MSYFGKLSMTNFVRFVSLSPADISLKIFLTYQLQAGVEG
jgi:hypothetical protein